MKMIWLSELKVYMHTMNLFVLQNYVVFLVEFVWFWEDMPAP